MTIEENGILTGTPENDDVRSDIPISIMVSDSSGFADTLKTTLNVNPSEYYMNTPFPNPFNPVTTIEYSLPLEAHVTLTIYNVSGQIVGVLEDKLKPVGKHSISWNAAGMPTGLYFCTLKANRFSETRKMVLVK